MKNPRSLIKKIPKPIRKMILRSAADTAAGKLARKVFETGTGHNTAKWVAGAFGNAGTARRMVSPDGLGAKAASAALGAVFPKKPGRVKLQSIHGSNKSAIDRLADLGLTTAVTAPIRRMQQRKRRTDIAGTAVVALAKIAMRVKWK